MTYSASTAKGRTSYFAKKLQGDKAREEKPIGKMPTEQIIGYLCYRHRGTLLITALILTNVLWLIKIHPGS